MSSSPPNFTRDYQGAIEALNSLQTNAAVLDEIRKQGPQAKGGERAMAETLDYLNRIGYQPADLNPLSVIHITGTKGKGSTSAFVSSLLRHLRPNLKVGLYTSPHLIAVRERIRIDGVPLREEVFAKYFWEVWDRLEKNKEKADPATPDKPAYFRYLTLVAYHAFLNEKVDTTILEVGVGGTYDSTNIVPKPVVTGITSLGIDHVFVLGKTLEEIAGQKAGIYKEDVPALTVEQPDEGFEVLRSRAEQVKARSFNVVREISELRQHKLGLAGHHQRINASLAIALVRVYLKSLESSVLPPPTPTSTLFSTSQVHSSSPTSQSHPHHPPPPVTSLPALPTDFITPSPLPTEIVAGLEVASWPGRCQVERDPDGDKRPGTGWYLDGAHTVESLKVCGEWWEEECKGMQKAPRPTRILFFNCTSGRSGADMLTSLLLTITSLDKNAAAEGAFDYVFFSTNVTYSGGVSKADLVSLNTSQDSLADVTIQKELADVWSTLSNQETLSPATRNAKVEIFHSIQDGLERVGEVARERGEGGPKNERVAVLVTGSLHLIGGVMEVAGLPL